MSYPGSLIARDIKSVFEDDEAFGTTLLALVIDNYGVESFEWEPETLRMQLKDDYDVTLGKLADDKIRALITCITTNQFYRSFEFFSAVCDVLNGTEADFNTFDPNTPEDIAWAVSEVGMIDSYDEKYENVDFSSEVRGYVGITLQENGIWKAPAVLKFADMPDTDFEAVSSDPVMFEASYASQTQKTAHLDDFVKNRMAELFAELDKAPLKYRTGGNIMEAARSGKLAL